MAINFRQIMDDAPIGRLQWGVAVMVTIVMFLDGLDYQIASFAAPMLMREWHLTKPQFAPLLAAAMIGMAVGTLVGSWASDRIGRRLVVCMSVAFFGAMTIACGYVRGPGEFVACRFVSGLGLGAAFPVAVGMMSEWMPRRLVSKAVSIMTIGIPMGIILGATAASSLLPHFGWRLFFMGVGSLCLAASALLTWRLPESPSYLILRGRSDQAHRLLARAWHRPVGDGRTEFLLKPKGDAERGLFVDSNKRVNLGLWLGFMSASLATYAIAGWLTVMLVGLHLPLQAALRGPVAYSLPAIAGTLSLGWMVARWGSRRVMLTLSVVALAAAGTTALATVIMSPDKWLYAIVFGGIAVAGFTIGALLAAVLVVAAAAYDTRIRSRGLGVVSALGRVAAILSSFAGGAVLALAGGSGFFALIAVLAGSVAASVLIINRHIPAAPRIQAGARALA